MAETGIRQAAILQDMRVGEKAKSEQNDILSQQNQKLGQVTAHCSSKLKALTHWAGPCCLSFALHFNEIVKVFYS